MIKEELKALKEAYKVVKSESVRKALLEKIKELETDKPVLK